MSNKTVKNQYEAQLFYSFCPIQEVWTIDITAPNAYIDAENAVDNVQCYDISSGYNLYALVSDNPIGVGLTELECSDGQPIVVTINGSDATYSPNAQEGTATIPAYSQVGWAVLIQADNTFGAITSVSITGGSAGEKITIIALPASSTFTFIGFDQGFSWDEGTTSRAIPNKYVAVDHWKRTRGETTISISQLYQSFNRAITYIRGRDFTLKAEIHDDGGAAVSEYIYFDKCRLASNPVTVGADGADITVAADGMYQKMVIIDGSGSDNPCE